MPQERQLSFALMSPQLSISWTGNLSPAMWLRSSPMADLTASMTSCRRGWRSVAEHWHRHDSVAVDSGNVHRARRAGGPCLHSMVSDHRRYNASLPRGDVRRRGWLSPGGHPHPGRRPRTCSDRRGLYFHVEPCLESRPAGADSAHSGADVGVSETLSDEDSFAWLWDAAREVCSCGSRR